VFPDELAAHPDAPLEAALSSGGIAEVMEDSLVDEVAVRRRRRGRPAA
jgi:hypothetical protein